MVSKIIRNQLNKYIIRHIFFFLFVKLKHTIHVCTHTHGRNWEKGNTKIREHLTVTGINSVESTSCITDYLLMDWLADGFSSFFVRKVRPVLDYRLENCRNMLTYYMSYTPEPSCQNPHYLLSQKRMLNALTYVLGIRSIPVYLLTTINAYQYYLIGNTYLLTYLGLLTKYLLNYFPTYFHALLGLLTYYYYLRNKYIHDGTYVLPYFLPRFLTYLLLPYWFNNVLTYYVELHLYLLITLSDNSNSLFCSCSCSSESAATASIDWTHSKINVRLGFVRACPMCF